MGKGVMKIGTMLYLIVLWLNPCAVVSFVSPNKPGFMLPKNQFSNMYISKSHEKYERVPPLTMNIIHSCQVGSLKACVLRNHPECD